MLFTVSFNGYTQDNVIVPGDNLIIEGLPKIPASLAEEVGRYSEFRYAGFASWHPSKREMLINTRFGDTYQVHQIKFPGGARTQLTFFKERVGGASFDPVKGDYFVFSKDIGGNENFQKYRYDFASGKTSLLTDGASRNIGGVWSNKGDRYAYHSTRRTGKDVDVYVINPADPASDKMLAQVEGGGWGVTDWSPDDSKLLLGEYLSVNESYLWLLDAKTGEKTLVTPKGDTTKVAYGDARFSKDGKGLYYTSDKNSEFQRLTYIDLATKKETVLTGHINWDVDEFAISHDRSMILFVTNEDGVSVLHLMDLQSGKEKSLPKLPVGLIYGITWHNNGKEFAFNFASSKASYDPYSVNIETGEIERWVMSETGGLNTENFSDASLIHWKSFDNRTISGFLYRPPSSFTGKRPVIIDIHGGPEGQSRPDFLGRNNYYLNELGIAILYPNVRGSTGYGKTFMKLDNGYLRVDSYKDISALLDWVKSQPDLDADRIMITGGSYGGHMTLAISTLYSDRIRCAIEIVGMSNLVTFLENTSGYRQDLRRVEYGDERDPKMREFLLKIAPISSADKIKKPLFIIQGANDPRVPVSEAEQMLATLKKIGTPAWYLVAKDEGHGFGKKKNQDFQFYSTVLFIKEFLLK
jgi:dipeptidyl aminopeptidase/acylaminoacyl peptidase